MGEATQGLKRGDVDKTGVQCLLRFTVRIGPQTTGCVQKCYFLSLLLAISSCCCCYYCYCYFQPFSLRYFQILTLIFQQNFYQKVLFPIVNWFVTQTGMLLGSVNKLFFQDLTHFQTNQARKPNTGVQRDDGCQVSYPQHGQRLPTLVKSRRQ